MFGINRVVSAIKNQFNKAKNSAAQAVKSVLSGLTSPSSVSFIKVSQKGVPEAAGTARGLVVIFTEGDFPGELAKAMAEETLGNIRSAVAPISRSGRLRDSFRVEPEGDSGYKITSDLPYAFSLLDENSMNAGQPSIGALMDWMQYKSEFNSLDYKEKRRAAFAIKGAIKNRTAGLSGRSDIRRLRPVGKRSYDYLSVALEQTIKQYESSDVNIKGIF